MILASPTQRAVLGRRFGANAYFLGGYDPAAAAFFAKGVSLGEAPLSASIKNAVNDLIVYEKANGLWTPQVAQYPFVGGTAVWHSLNLNDPETFRITWNGTVTHNSAGATGNASDGYGDTNLKISDVLTASSFGVTDYVSAIGSSNHTFIFDFDGSVNCGIEINGDGGFTNGDANFPTTRMVVATASIGMHTVSRTAANAASLYDNGVSVATAATGVGSFSTADLMMFQLGTSGTFSGETRSFSAVHSGLSSTLAALFYTGVQAFQTSLGRQV